MEENHQLNEKESSHTALVEVQAFNKVRCTRMVKEHERNLNPKLDHLLKLAKKEAVIEAKEQKKTWLVPTKKIQKPNSIINTEAKKMTGLKLKLKEKKLGKFKMKTSIDKTSLPVAVPSGADGSLQDGNGNGILPRVGEDGGVKSPVVYTGTSQMHDSGKNQRTSMVFSGDGIDVDFFRKTDSIFLALELDLSKEDKKNCLMKFFRKLDIEVALQKLLSYDGIGFSIKPNEEKRCYSVIAKVQGRDDVARDEFYGNGQKQNSQHAKKKCCLFVLKVIIDECADKLFGAIVLSNDRSSFMDSLDSQKLKAQSLQLTKKLEEETQSNVMLHNKNEAVEAKNLELAAKNDKFIDDHNQDVLEWMNEEKEWKEGELLAKEAYLKLQDKCQKLGEELKTQEIHQDKLEEELQKKKNADGLLNLQFTKMQKKCRNMELEIEELKKNRGNADLKTVQDMFNQIKPYLGRKQHPPIQNFGQIRKEFGRFSKKYTSFLWLDENKEAFFIL